MKPTALFDLSGKIAVITGAGNGIGKASAKILSRFGARVVLADYNLSAAHKAALEIERDGGVAIAVSCDVTQDDELIRLRDETLERYGSVHILVNNVGGGGGGKESPLEIEVADFAKVFERNVFSMWRLSQLLAPHMQEAGYGSIVNISSMASVLSNPAMSAYASSKAAVNHMTKNLAFDYGPIVRVNAVAPGAVRTAALQTVLTPELEKKMLRHTPLRRLGEVEDIAGAVLYFAAPVSNWVSGQVLFVNGGGEQTLD